MCMNEKKKIQMGKRRESLLEGNYKNAVRKKIKGNSVKQMGTP